MLKITEICKKIKHKFDNKRLHMDLELQVARIRENNYKKLMKELLIFVSDTEEQTTGLLLTPREAKERAHAMFVMGKITGAVDALNRKVC